MADYLYTLYLTLQTPVLSQSVGALGFGYDMGMLKDEKKPVLPGSLIRGNLRHALNRFADVLAGQPNKSDVNLRKKINQWFGHETSEKLGDEPTEERASLNFDYYWRCQPCATKQPPRNRITINPTTGTVQRRALIVIETPFPTGETLMFVGNILSQFPNRKEAELAKEWLEKAAKFLPSLGSLKGVGYGKVLGVSISMKEIERTPSPPYQGDTRRIGIVLTLDRPFCIAKPRARDTNLFEGENFVPGGVIKGALAREMSKEDKKDLRFDEWQFTHALPSPQHSPHRERVLPLSLAWVGKSTGNDKLPIKDHLIDLALLPSPKEMPLCNRKSPKDGKYSAPKFQIDWKDEDRDSAFLALFEQGLLSQPVYERYLAVHTAIEPETGQADEGKLFSLDCVKQNDMIWCADIDLSPIDDKQRPAFAQRLLQTLNAPIVGIGKTKAIATVAVQARSFLDESPFKPLEEEGLYLVTLQTPAELFTDADTQSINSSGGADALEKLYADYWDTVSDGSLELVRYFAAQKRVGGEFLWHHSLKHENSPDKSYRPFWLTEAGSVFVLKPVEPEHAKENLENWKMRGLPPVGGGESHSQWAYNPYIRENGYGEIRINDEIHLNYRANGEEWS